MIFKKIFLWLLEICFIFIISIVLGNIIKNGFKFEFFLSMLVYSITLVLIHILEFEESQR